jgi:drug/metabolite transporter (DMT)-like permease
LPSQWFSDGDDSTKTFQTLDAELKSEKPIMASQKKAYIALTITSVVWGTTWVGSKMGVAHVPAFELASIRQLLGGTIYVAFFLIMGHPFPTKKQFAWLIPMAFLMFVSSNGIATYGLQFITSGLGALIAALYPLSVVLIERYYFKAIKITPQTLLGLFLGLLGILFIFYKDSLQMHGTHYLLGVGLSLFAMVTWSVGSIIMSRKKIDINAYYSIGWQMLISAFTMGLITLLSGNYIPIHEIPAKTWGVLAYMVLGGSIVAFASFVYSMKHLKPAIASLYAYVNPIVAIWVGYLLLNEKITLNSIIGTISTLVGVYLVNNSLKNQKDPVDAIADADGM